MSEPPRVALAVLKRVIGPDEPLVGDLIEEFHVRQSRAWFRWQVLTAVLLRGLQPRTRSVMAPLPMGLFNLDPAVHPAAAPMRLVSGVRAVEINMSGIPVDGIGGLGLVAVVVFITLVMPAAWWLTVFGLVGGTLLGTILVLARRREGISPGNLDRTVLGLRKPGASGVMPVVPRIVQRSRLVWSINRKVRPFPAF